VTICQTGCDTCPNLAEAERTGGEESERLRPDSDLSQP
jgi:hypothetical protein